MEDNSQYREKLLFQGKEYGCSVDVTLAIIGGKWKPAILWHLKKKTMRFSELQRKFPDTTRKMLTQQLRELEDHGMVHREVYTQVPPKVEYSFTEKGRSIIPVLDLMYDWGKDFLRE
ncbi:MAG: winged helix-turn-helix transcriptional regulator [Deltaproteobacteria bacterium]|nr:winged helix-turn-helix transcriptional regulator [Deltaproteobacteria bacterium]